MASRAETGLINNWLWTVDRQLITAIGALMICGLVFGLAASPAVAERLGLSTFHFVHRQALYLIPAIAVMLMVSFLSPRYIRRLALLILVAGMAMVAATIFTGAEIKGARRWINLPSPLGAIQPSEFVKPAFVIVAAWAFSEGAKRTDMPGTLLAILLLPATIVPLILQPDIGQTMLIAIVWCGLFFLAGLHILWVFGLLGLGAGGILLAYKLVPHVTKRVNRFFDDKGTQDSFQVDAALESFVSGGFFGKGPGEGTVKRYLPDAHTDFIFAVTGEEFGLIVCVGLVALFAFIVLRSLWLAGRTPDPFCRFAAVGLAMLFGVQSAINMAVNLHLMPPKGMTLPFISYGGSSLLSLAIGMGFLIAVTRKRPRAETQLPESPAYGQTSAGAA
ncbi:MAG: cell division protein FtsW [Methylocystis sp.]|nr:cell division protein FtsW [Methylocystis sp.]MCA3583363.1 cell division protein FtsW [Methylocystis sp.]MCA3588507.1 cell division protein FtsW [Methylocystis sp.]MCA3591882.1 cell division protein FtsW [Methylocystis sp.]